MDNVRQRIVDWYGDAGYGYANASWSWSRQTRESRVVNVSIRIIEGDLVYVEDIVVRGNRRVSAETIRANIPLEPGDVFSRKKIMEARQNLWKIDYFTNIGVANEPAPGNRRDRQILVIGVQERW